jgi:hypothetical protein
MPALVNRGYAADLENPAKKGETVTIEIPPSVTTSAVTPAASPTAASDQTPTTKTLSLDNWRKSAPFALNDQEITQIDTDKNYIPTNVSASIEALAAYVNEQIHATYTGVYGYVGTAGVTPFAEATPVVDAASAAQRELNKQKAPLAPRYGILGHNAAHAARSLQSFYRADMRGQSDTMKTGDIGTAFGFDWKEDANVTTHTTGAAGTPLLDYGSGYAVGTTTIHMDGFTTKPSAGDVFKFPAARASGVIDEQTYVVSSSTTLVGTDSDVTFAPGLKVALAAGDDSCAIKFMASHAVNLAFHRDAIGFASRPLMDTDPTGRRVMQSLADPVTGLVLRLEVLTHMYKMTQWEFDILFGTALIRPELACRIAGKPNQP